MEGLRAALEKSIASRGLSLTPDEALKVASWVGRMPTPVELHLFDTMWSEHCSYKSSRRLLSVLPTNSPDVTLGPGEDAGAFRFAEHAGKCWDVVVAHESHNHPSQVLPVEGAATGVGGIVRDVYCMGATVTGVMDMLRFGDPLGPAGSRVRSIARGVVNGIWQYGNALGVPNQGGDTCFHPGYDDNCLVNVVAMGVVESSRLVHSRVPEAAHGEPYVLVLVGKPTDSTGFGGATFASADLDEGGLRAVQVADPFLKRVVSIANAAALDFLFESGASFGFKDLGAGGIACVSSEMAAAGGMGVELFLDEVPTAVEGLPPEVIACSETQERYGLAVPERLAARILAIYNEDYEMPKLHPGAGAALIGRFVDDPVYRVWCRGTEAACAPVEAITRGIHHERPWREAPITAPGMPSREFSPAQDISRMALSLSGCSRKPLFSYYDCEVQGIALFRPGEADASVSLPVPGCMAGLAVSGAGNPWIGELDPFLGGASAVAEAVRNVVAVGATPLAATDCLNYGSPEVPEVMWQFRRGLEGISEACKAFGFTGGPLPIVSGNVSFYNQTPAGRAIPPSPVVAVFGRISDASKAVDISLKEPGNLLVLFGPRRGELGGSLYAREFCGGSGGPPPGFRPAEEREMAGEILEWISAGRARACHDISEGGMALAALEMILADSDAGGCGIELSCSCDAIALCAENAGYLVEVRPGDLPPQMPGFASVIGTVTGDGSLSGPGWRLEVSLLRPAWADRLASVVWREE